MPRRDTPLDEQPKDESDNNPIPNNTTDNDPSDNSNTTTEITSEQTNDPNNNNATTTANINTSDSNEIKAPFFKGTIEEAIAESKKTQMLFLVTVLSRENNPESERMERETFADPTVCNLISQCVGLCLYEGTPEAKSCIEFFGVDKIPVTYMFGLNGNPYKVLKGFYSSEDFTKNFEEAKKLHVTDLQKFLLQQILGMMPQPNLASPPQQNSNPPSFTPPQTTISPTPTRVEQPVQRPNPTPAPTAQNQPQLSLQSGVVRSLKREGDLERELAAANNTLVVVDFSAIWCGPCKAIAPVFEKMAKNYPAAVFLKIDVDQLKETASRYKVSALPTFYFFIGRDKVDDMRGADHRRLEELTANWYNYVTNPKPTTPFQSTTTVSTPTPTTSQTTAKLPSTEAKKETLTSQTSQSSSVEKRKAPEPKITTQTLKPETQAQPKVSTPQTQPKTATPQPKPSTPTTHPKPPPKVHTQTNLIIRLTNGHALKSTFLVIDRLGDVCDYINKNRTDGRHGYTLMTTHPRHVFTNAEMDKTLSQLDLVPSATLTLTPNDPTVVPTPMPTTATAKGGYSSGSGTASANVGWGAWIKNTVTSYIPFWGSSENTQNQTFWEHQPNPELERNIRDGNQNANPQQPSENENNTGLTRRRGGDGKVHSLSDNSNSEDKDKNSYWNGNSTEFK
eukprot:TRINITY_DN7587_c0_g1_i2.p1 TRINITY_DN7587_c0_g1~~TRINITY_DN7587_c0_g1_i2.p1  ORF type:complete len:677 (-),score=165.58 TRINITY_DN7587_c0_g1_i2:116-2146(-)